VKVYVLLDERGDDGGGQFISVHRTLGGAQSAVGKPHVRPWKAWDVHGRKWWDSKYGEYRIDLEEVQL
jgi:hypothetical protein